MNIKELKIVKFFIDVHAASIIDDRQEREKFVEKVFEDVVKDVEECAADNGDWNDEDVRIALARVILKKFEVE